MSKHLLVPAALKSLIAAALPGADVKGMAADEAKPSRVGPLGQVLVRSGDPGTPEIDLSPPAWHWERSMPIEVAGYQSGTVDGRTAAYQMIAAIGAAIAADRTLGGLVDWLEAEAPTDGEADATGAQPLSWADFAVVATYSTASPLG